MQKHCSLVELFFKPTQVVFDSEIGGKIKIVVVQKWGRM